MRVSSHYGREIFRVPDFPVPPNIVIADIERGMVDEEDCRFIRLLGERLFEPNPTRLAENALSFASGYGIEGDQADWMVFNGVMKKRPSSR